MSRATITRTPPIREHNRSLLTVPKQSCHSRGAALQGFTAPVCHFPGCHSWGKHLLFSVTVMQPGHASEPRSTPSIKLRCPSCVHGACRIEIPIWQEGDGCAGHACRARNRLLRLYCAYKSPAAIAKIQILIVGLGWGWG